MSAWKRRAIELFPDLRSQIQEASIYGVFVELLPRVREAHADGDFEELRRIYGFAEWCHRQKARHLWNAAGVSFYEHLVDEEPTRREMLVWIKPDIFEDLDGLFRSRMGEEGE